MFLKSYTMFYLVGLGLFDAGDISLKGLECLKSVDKIYAEFSLPDYLVLALMRLNPR